MPSRRLPGAGVGASAAMSAAQPVLLAIDCSAASCSAALWRDGGVAAHRFEAMARGQAEALIPLIDGMMDAAAARYGDLDLIAVTVGPGSFTGLRIGLAAARGLALAAGVPVLGLTSFAGVAAAVPADSAAGLAVAIDDRRGGVYWQEFADGPDAHRPDAYRPASRHPVGAPAAIAADTLAADIAGRLRGRRLRVAGDGAPLLRAALGDAAGIDVAAETGPPDAAWIAREAAALAADFLAGRPVGLPPVPLYLRPPDVRLPGTAVAGALRPGSATPP